MKIQSNITFTNIRQAVQDLGLGGQPLCLHSSLRSFGWVEDGAATVIRALLAEECTVMVPTFSYGFAVPPPPGLRPAQNGWDYASFEGPTAGLERLYSPESSEIDPEMGAIPAALMAMPGRVRGNHPLDSFAAVGPLAQSLIAGQQPLEVFAPLKALAETGGSIILIGVGLDKMTLLHFAEQMAGRNLFIRWANGPGYQPMAVEVGGCSDGFPNLEPVLSPLVKEAKIGQSRWRVFPAKETLAAAAKAIQAQPKLTHCGNEQCHRCHDAVLGGPWLGEI